MEVLIDRRTGHRIIPFGTPSIQFMDYTLNTFPWNPNGPQHDYHLYDGARPYEGPESFQKDYWDVFGEKCKRRMYSRPGNMNSSCPTIWMTRQKIYP
jgi:hypothetical protein